MNTGQIVCGIIFLALAIGAFVISFFQFKEKGYLFNNAYVWASEAERKKMDENKETKRPYYCQSGFVFIFIGISLLIFSVYIVTNWTWTYIAFGVLLIIAVIYAIVSSIKIEKHK